MFPEQEREEFLTQFVSDYRKQAAEASPPVQPATPTAPAANSPTKDYSLKGLEQLWPTLFGGAAGAAYGAVRAPSGSPLRGALVGGLAGAGAGTAYTGAHQMLSSPYGSLMRESPSVSAALTLGSAGLGGLGGLHAGRRAADKLGLPDKDKDNELDELNLLHRKNKWLPVNLRNYFNS